MSEVVEVDGSCRFALELCTLDTDLQIFPCFLVWSVLNVLNAVDAISLLRLILLRENDLFQTQVLLAQARCRFEDVRVLIVGNSSDLDGSEDFKVDPVTGVHLVTRAFDVCADELFDRVVNKHYLRRYATLHFLDD